MRRSAESYGDKVAQKSLDKAEFLETHGDPPWQELNEVLASAGISHKFEEPTLINENQTWTPKLVTNQGDPIDLNQLSSGEKTILGIELWKKTRKAGSLQGDSEKYKLLLLDEVDANLHPSQIKNLIQYLNDEVVKKNECNVILTTHSPTTVALSPEESLHVLSSGAPHKIAPVNHDQALEALCSGLPLLSVKYSNRRQVFVESKLDAKRYTELYEIAKARLETERSLIFIGPGANNDGGCSVVEHLVNVLGDSGIDSVLGLIDWDGKHSDSNVLKVIGSDHAYSIESILIDPMLLSLSWLLQDENLAKKNLPNVQFPPAQNWGAEMQTEIQKIVDAFCERLGFPVAGDCRNRVYCSGLEVCLPNKMLDMQGHEYADLVRRTFSGKTLKGSDDEIMDHAISLLKNYPDMMPICIVEAFKKLV